jgi:hypothetical protein
VKAPNQNKFLMFPPITGIDGAKAGMLEDGGKTVESDVAIAGADIDTPDFTGLKQQYDWWETNKEFATTDKGPVEAATLYGSRMALRVTALVPATMAVLYLILIVGFKAPKEHGDPSLADEAPGTEL